jgi:hypothetical protein
MLAALFISRHFFANYKEMLSVILEQGRLSLSIWAVKPPGWNAIRMACRHRNINMDMRLCRKIHGSWLHSHGVSAIEADFLQGRVSPSVFGRHYLAPDSTLRQRVLDATEQLQKQIMI